MNIKKNNTLFLVFFSTIIISAVFFPGPAAAESSDEDGEKAAVIVVTGSKIEQAQEDSVEKVTVVPEEKIAEMGAKNVAEVLENVPGVTVTQHPMEGASMQGLSGAYVKVLVDGIAVGGDVGGASPISLIPVSDIERIEIIFGASSALYGSDAMGGVINIITKKNNSMFDAVVKQEIDSHKHAYSNLSIGYGNRIFALKAAGSFDNMPGLITREFDPMGEQIDTYVFPNTRLGFGRFTADFFLPSGEIGVYGMYANHLRYMSQSPDIANQFFSNKAEGGIKSRIDLTDSLRMSIFSSYKFFNHFFDEVYTAYKENNIKRRESVFHEVESELSVNNDFTIEHSLLGGINVKWEMMQGVDFAEPKHLLLLSMFSQYTWNLAGEDLFFLVPGFRMDWAPPMQTDDKNLWQATPKLSLRYNPIDKLALRLSYGMGFKVPTLKQKYWLFFHPAPVNFVLHGNPDLKPERSQGINTSVEYSPLMGFTISASGYFNYVKDLIFAVETSTTEGFYPDASGVLHPYVGERNYMNIDRVMTTGGNLSLSYMHRWVESRLTYTIAGMFNYDTESGKYFKGAYFTPHQLDLDITGIIPVSLTRIKLGIQWNAPQSIREGFDVRAANMIKPDSDSSYGTSPDKLLVNLHVSQKFWKQQIEIYGGVKNLLNNLHFRKGSDGRDQKNYYGLTEGITAYFGLGFKYRIDKKNKNQEKQP